MSGSESKNGARDFDVIIVGAGVAGAALAAHLGRAGRRTLLVERDWSEPRLIVGELLQPGGLRSLRSMGLEAAVEGIDAQPIRGFAVISGDEGRALPYPSVAGEGPARGRAFHHGRFVRQLREAAAAEPAVTVIEGTVTDVLLEGGRACGVRLRPRPGTSGAGSGSAPGVAPATAVDETVRAGLVVAADGRMSTLRAKLSGAAPADGADTVAGGARRGSWSVGVLLHGAPPPYPGHGHVILARPAPMLCYPIGSDDVRVLVDVPGDLPPVRGGALAEHLRVAIAPQLPSVLRAAFLEAVAVGRIAAMPNLLLTPRPSRTPGAVSVGDALNMRHPLTGGGMTVALNDVRLLAECLSGVSLGPAAAADAAAVDAAVGRFHERRRALAATVDMMAGALYAVFSAGGPEIEGLRRALLSYWDLGGPAVRGPMTLLAGLAARPPEVVVHFLAVALLGVGREVAVPPARAPRAVADAARMATAAFTTIRPHLARLFAPA